MKTERKTDKIQKLLNRDQQIFHTQDLAVIWQEDNKNTLYTTIKRYIKRGILHRIQKGLYSTEEIDQLNPKNLGAKLLHDYSYISTETVLSEQGVIFQELQYLTFVSNQSRRIMLEGYSFRSRQLKSEYLYNDLGVEVKDGYKQAKLERAVADILYFNSDFYFDNKEPIDWDKVEFIQQEIGY